MLRVTRLGDYGLSLLAFLASGPEGRWYNAREAAEGTRIPLPMASKILKILARKGLLRSQRGAAGGYRLASEPARISVAQVVHALEGPTGVTRCTTHPDSGGGCGRTRFCVARPVWRRIDGKVRDVLESVTLAELVQPAVDSPAGSVDGRNVPPAEEDEEEAR